MGVEFQPDSIQLSNSFALRRVGLEATVGDQFLVDCQGSSVQDPGAARATTYPEGLDEHRF